MSFVGDRRRRLALRVVDNIDFCSPMVVQVGFRIAALTMASLNFEVLTQDADMRLIKGCVFNLTHYAQCMTMLLAPFLMSLFTAYVPTFRTILSNFLTVPYHSRRSDIVVQGLFSIVRAGMLSQWC